MSNKYPDSAGQENIHLSNTGPWSSITSPTKRSTNEEGQEPPVDTKKSRSDVVTTSGRVPLEAVQRTYGPLSRSFYKRADGRSWDEVLNHVRNTTDVGKNVQQESNTEKLEDTQVEKNDEEEDNGEEDDDEEEKVEKDDEEEDNGEEDDDEEEKVEKDDDLWEDDNDSDGENPTLIDVDDVVENEISLEDWKIEAATRVINNFKAKLSNRKASTKKSVSHNVLVKELDKILGIFQALEVEKKKKLSDYIRHLPQPKNKEFDAAMVQIKLRSKQHKHKRISIKCPKKDCTSKCSTVDTAKEHYMQIHLKWELWECVKCSRKFKSRQSIVKHVNSIHLEKKTPCSSCGVLLGPTGIHDHEIWEHYTPIGQQVLFSPVLGKIESRLFEIDYITIGFGYTWNLFKVNWIDDDGNPVNLSVGISRFVRVDIILHKMWKSLLRIMSDPHCDGTWVHACGSARNEIRKGHMLDWASAKSLGIPAVSKGVATQVKAVARKHYDAIYILATEEAEIYLTDKIPRIIEQLDSFLEELPPHNKQFVLSNRS